MTSKFERGTARQNGAPNSDHQAPSRSDLRIATARAQDGVLSDTQFFARVKLCDTQKNCYKPGHEILKINTDSSLEVLCKEIQARFQAFSKLGSSERANMKGVVVTKADKVKKVKIIYSGNSWNDTADGVAETTLTETNCANTLAMLKSWEGSNWGHFCVVIAPGEDGVEDSDDEYESDE